ncbi:polyribonucleotide nucleotidyltransferase [Brachyspira aalborgi]|uniref:Polyribonucleotide nucleotidyltransferase n=1 Tax=Brachyspira aalborgi TaxID=29522 RepID=A0A5C8EB45_9SPIR|nr:polyribonucleotide nucleotidyltransferase [Brachyspira aalborgi]TXJ34975.1 polyribonucleotide nucleotidyltransferase [Brachyspira aalborgi]
MVTVKSSFCGEELVLETGLLAKQAHGAVTLRLGNTTILATVVAAKEPNLESDFFPLTVNYNEKYYAGGKIPGGFLKREGKPRDKEILISRIIDRPLRPLFPEGFRNEVQVIPTVLSVDSDMPTDALALIASSAALTISWIPFDGPVAAVRIGYINGEYIVNPKNSELLKSDLDIIVAGSKDAILMIEGEAKEVSEEVFIGAIELAHKEMQKYIDIQNEMANLCGTQKIEQELFEFDKDLLNMVNEYGREKINAANYNPDKEKRNESIDNAFKEIEEYIKTKTEDEKLIAQVKGICHSIEEEIVREAIVEKGMRPDGRALDEIRKIDTMINLIPRVHGSGLFTRGQTQCLSIVTLGSEKDAQLMDDIYGKDNKTFMLHYNFPPFSVGEVGRYGAPGRREIGHGNLAERSFNAVLPSKDKFPYTIRVVSEILESNGSSSMATICASTMSLLSAGVPLNSSVAGIAMGLATYKNGYKILTDIQGVEDHLGDMDFKVAGTRKGITAFQLDIKLTGISAQILKEALEQAKKARFFILDKIDATISNPAEISDFAPKFKMMEVNPEKIRVLIGPGGKNIKAIIDETGSDVEIQDSGIVNIFAPDGPTLEKTIELINSYVKDPEVGEVYDGVVKDIKEFGAFVEILPGVEGLCHISELAYKRVMNVEEILKIGDTVKVKIIDNRGGKYSLSRKALLEKPDDYVEEEGNNRRERKSRNNNHNNNRRRY